MGLKELMNLKVRDLKCMEKIATTNDKWGEKLKASRDNMKAKAEAQALQKANTKAELDAQGIAYCPRCLSTSITAQKKGGSIVKGLVGGAFLGPIGLLAGDIGRNKIEVICLKCHYKFKA